MRNNKENHIFHVDPPFKRREVPTAKISVPDAGFNSKVKIEVSGYPRGRALTEGTTYAEFAKPTIHRGGSKRARTGEHFYGRQVDKYDVPSGRVPDSPRPGDVKRDEEAEQRDRLLKSKLPLAIAGDKDALNTIMQTIAPLVNRYCKARLGEGVAADEAAQETLIGAVAGLSRFRDEGPPLMAWVYGIARHKVIDAFRMQGREVPELTEDTPERVDVSRGPEARVLSFEDSQALGSLLEVLPERQREIIKLSSILDLSSREVGERLGMTSGAVRVAKHRALRRLKDTITGKIPKSEPKTAHKAKYESLDIANIRGLSPYQREVLELRAGGLTNEEIGESLDRNRKTVQRTYMTALRVAQSQRVMELNSQGLSDAEIADELGMSSKTVSKMYKEGVGKKFSILYRNAGDDINPQELMVLQLSAQGITPEVIAVALAVSQSDVEEMQDRVSAQIYVQRIMELRSLNASYKEIGEELDISQNRAKDIYNNIQKGVKRSKIRKEESRLRYEELLASENVIALTSYERKILELGRSGLNYDQIAIVLGKNSGETIRRAQVVAVNKLRQSPREVNGIEVYGLTEREFTVFELFLEGMSTGDICQRLGIKRNILNELHAKLINKLKKSTDDRVKEMVERIELTDVDKLILDLAESGFSNADIGKEIKARGLANPSLLVRRALEKKKKDSGNADE